MSYICMSRTIFEPIIILDLYLYWYIGMRARPLQGPEDQKTRKAKKVSAYLDNIFNTK